MVVCSGVCLWKIVFSVCFVPAVLAVQDSTGSNVTLTDITTAVNNVSTTDGDLDKPTEIDTSGDIIITNTPDPETEAVTGAEESNSTTVNASTTSAPATTTEKVWSPCSLKPCKNGGVCKEDSVNSNLYSCSCAEYYTGTHCQVTDICESAEDGGFCSNGACAYERDGLSKSCKCFLGMFWDEFEKECRDPKPPCFPNPCHNMADCAVQDGGGHKCECEKTFEGEDCRIENKCGEADICENGICVLDKEKRMKYCHCNADFYWNDKDAECQTAQAPCFPNPCKNDGTCHSINSTDCYCNCSKGYGGEFCQLTDYCTPVDGSGDACENGACSVSQSEKSMKCKCNSGFYFDEGSHTCKEIRAPCSPSPCSNDGICVPLSSDTFNCSCSPGFTGTTCTDLDYRVLDGGNTFCSGATCINSKELGIFFCSCSEGKYFDYVSRKCVDVDFCPLISCGEHEECTESTCHCQKPYEWNNSTNKCEPDFCSGISCPSEDLICYSEIDGYRCACESGSAFNGTHCNAGASCRFPSLNPCDRKCKLSEENEPVCSCDDEFFQLNADNETCSTLFNNATCSNKSCGIGECMVSNGTEVCVCPLGFTEVSGECTDVCTAGLLPKGYCPGDKCEATGTGFRCRCEGKHVLSGDGTTCTARRFCQKGETGWTSCSKKNSICTEAWNTKAGYRCHCRQGQIQDADGICQDVCSLEENQKTCSTFGAKCDVSASGGPTCRCPPYFRSFKNDTFCNKQAPFSYMLTLPLSSGAYMKDQQINERATSERVLDKARVEKDVQKAVGRLLPGLQHTNALAWSTSSGGYILCELELQFSSTVPDSDLQRVKLEDNCQTTKEEASCLLPPSLVLQKNYIRSVVWVEETNPCDSSIKEDLCGSETVCSHIHRAPKTPSSEHWFVCSCKPGFAVRSRRYPFQSSQSYIETCKDINECLEESSCPRNMNCANSIGSYSCSCKSGYRIQDPSNPSEGCVEICNPNPCFHGSCSKTTSSDFDCSCESGYSGKLCNLQDENFKRARNNTIIVGAVLGGVLLATLIICFVYISRIKKKKYLNNGDSMLYVTEMTERRNPDSGRINNAFQRE